MGYLFFKIFAKIDFKAKWQSKIIINSLIINEIFEIAKLITMK